MTEKQERGKCDETEIYTVFCKPQLDALFKKNEDAELHRQSDRAAILDELKNLNKKLFIDNGCESFQTRINRLDRWVKGVCRAMIVLAIPILLIMVKSAWEVFMQYVRR